MSVRNAGAVGLWRLVLAAVLAGGLAARGAGALAPAAAPAPATAGPGAAVEAWAAECQTLESLKGIAGRVRGAIGDADDKARDRVLAEAAMEAHALAAGRETGPAAALEHDLRVTARNFQQLTLPAFQMLEEQERWRRLEAEAAARLASRQRVLDGLRLWHKARQDPAGGLPLMVQAEAMLDGERASGQSEARLATVLRALRADMAAVALPSLFEAGSGMELLRLPPPADEWYVSRGPVSWRLFSDFLSEVPGTAASGCVLAGKADLDRKTLRWVPRRPEQPATQVDGNLAERCAAWVGRRLNGQGALPTTALMPLAMAAVPDAPKGLAWWTRNPWDGGAGAARDWRHEFGVRMFTLYDPDAVYGAGTACGELASAWSPKIGFWIVVPAETVAAERLHRLRAELKPADQPAAAVTTKGMP